MFKLNITFAIMTSFKGRNALNRVLVGLVAAMITTIGSHAQPTRLLSSVEDPTVIRKLGVDEKSQLAQSNAYSLNRDLSSEQNKVIIQTYMELKKNLPIGSPGEWYTIYPPFQKGFGSHNDIWQYMNGGVGGHVAGELALGAYRNGKKKAGDPGIVSSPPNSSEPVAKLFKITFSLPTSIAGIFLFIYKNDAVPAFRVDDIVIEKL